MKVALLLPVFALSACGSSSPSSGDATDTVSHANDAVDQCVERGVAYFKEIGSYPTLSSAPNAGRTAEEVAQERCGRTTTAF